MKMRSFGSTLKCLALLVLALATFMSAAPNSSSKFLLYVGIYGKGIYAYRFNAQEAKLESLGVAGEFNNPSFVNTDPSHRYLYAVSEVEGHHDGEIGAFRIDHQSGKLTLLNQKSSAGTSPCHLAVDSSSKLIAAANYGNGTVPVFSLNADGSLGDQVALLKAEGSGPTDRQTAPHAHQIVFSPGNHFMYVPDLGLDKIRTYRIDPTAPSVKAADPAFSNAPTGAGPRHIVFSSNGKYAYVINELTSVVTVYTVNAQTGALTLLQTLPATADGNHLEGAAEILLHPSGRFLYASVRGPGVIAVYAVDANTGQLHPVQSAATGGTFPRGVEFDPTGSFLFVGDQKTNEFTFFRVDKANGQLSPTGQKFEVPSPVSFLFIPQ